MKMSPHPTSPPNSGWRSGSDSARSTPKMRRRGRRRPIFWRLIGIAWSDPDHVVTLDANIWIAGFDATDVFHGRSSTFLREVTRRGLPLHGPASVLVEVGCVLARRFRNPAAGLQAAAGVAAHRLMRLRPLD